MKEGIVAYIWSDENEKAEDSDQESLVDMQVDEFDGDEHRCQVRHLLESCFSHIWHGRAKVLFSDELAGL